jgi:hypothetical protein
MLGMVMHAMIPLASPAWRVNLLSVLLSTCAPRSLSLSLYQRAPLHVRPRAGAQATQAVAALVVL